MDVRRRVVRCSRGRKWRGRSNAIPISARTSREPTIPPPAPTSASSPGRPHPTMWTSTSGWVAESERDRKREREGGSWRQKSPLRAGWLAEWADMYAVSAPPTCRHLGIDVDQAEGRNFCAARGRLRCTHQPAMCVSAPLHIPHSLSLTPSDATTRVPSHAAASAPRPTPECARMRAREEHAEERRESRLPWKNGVSGAPLTRFTATGEGRYRANMSCATFTEDSPTLVSRNFSKESSRRSRRKFTSWSDQVDSKQLPTQDDVIGSELLRNLH